MRDASHKDLFGSDCWKEILDVSATDNKWCNFTPVGAFPPSSFSRDSFDVIYLYSVFSHLSEDCHLAWVQEFHRILKPGGILITTTRSYEYLNRLNKNRNVDSSNGLKQSMLATAAFDNFSETKRKYLSGEFCFAGTGGGGPLSAEFYGEASIPPGYVQKMWRNFELCEVVAPTRTLDQVTYCVRKAP